MKQPRTIWIIKTPGGEFIEYEEPLNQDWTLCSKSKFIEVLPPSDDTAAMEAAANEYGEHIVNHNHSLGTYKIADFKAGWLAKAAFDKGGGG